MKADKRAVGYGSQKTNRRREIGRLRIKKMGEKGRERRERG